MTKLKIFSKNLPTIALLGNPNSGKTLLFNNLTGLKMQSANYPGTTVEIKEGVFKLDKQEVLLCDLPGLYDLEADSPEEEISRNYLAGKQKKTPDLIIFTLDSLRLSQGLFLLSQILEIKIPIIVVITKTDLAEKKSINIEYSKLENKLNCPVLAISNNNQSGYPELLKKVSSIMPKLQLAEETEHRPICSSCSGCPYTLRHQASETLCDEICPTKVSPGKSLLLDKYILHPVFGLTTFAISMFVFFWLIFFLASFPTDWINNFFNFISQLIDRQLSNSWFKDLIINGIISGVGGILAFLPQIMLLFFLLNLLENTGYLTRIVCLIDKYLKKLGLPGSAFIPMLSAHTCAIPAILSTRIIRNRRDRLLTIFILPFFSCSARIPVYVMLTAMIMPNSPTKAAIIFMLCYLSGIIVALLTAFILRLGTKSQPAKLIAELPRYSVPSLRWAFRNSIDQGKIFIKNAGTFIFAFSIIIWFLSYFPNQNLEDSFLAMLGKNLTPLFEPLGFNWQITIGILTSFLAREVIISTFSIIFHHDYSSGAALSEQLSAITTTNNQLLFDLPTSIALLVFFIFALQCFPTLIVAWKETNSRKFVIFQFIYAFILAYGLAYLARNISMMFL